MKKAILIVLIFAIGLSCFAGQFTTVPLDHEAYRIIDWATIAGIIPMQSDVKPYNQDKVVDLLTTISKSSLIGIDRRNHVEQIIASFNKSDSTEIKDILTNGYYQASKENISVAVGGTFESVQTFGVESTSSDFVWDSRNTLSAFIRGDFKDAFSFDLNFQVLFDKLAPTAFAQTDFRIDADGFYLLHGTLASVQKWNQFNLGISSRPELSTSLFDKKLAVRFASIERDWGAGVNNIIISPSAGTINAVDIDWTPTDWFSYSVVMGSLGKVELGNGGVDSPKASGTTDPNANGTVMGVLYPSDMLHDDYYDNNISTHKAEITFFKNFKVSVWESLIYRTRFELSYINPLSIYMFEQNKNGDFDNVLAGLDFQFRIKNFGILYATFGMDEFNLEGNPLTNPRNIFAYQAGLKMMLLDRGFGEVVLQATYIPAFYGSHYSYDLSASNPWGRTGYSTAYVNKGNLIGYPVNPDTVELLALYETNIKPNVEVYTKGRIQLRSSQYATHATGTNILDTMDYAAFAAGNYQARDFLHNIWNAKGILDIGATTKFYNPSISVFCNMQLILDRTRQFAAIPNQVYNYSVHNTGTSTWVTDWKLSYNVNATIGTRIYL